MTEKTVKKQKSDSIAKKWWFWIIIAESVVILILIITLIVILVSGGSSKTDEKRPLTTKTSSDKYTWYIKDYVGRNASSVCTYRTNKECMDNYGKGAVTINFITEDGSNINSDNISKYRVTDQNIDPDTELKLEFKKSSSGKEYENLIESQSIEEIDVNVERIK